MAPERGLGVHLMDSPLGEGDRLYEAEHLPVLYGETLEGTPLSLLNVTVIGALRLHGWRSGNTVDARAHVASLAHLPVRAAQVRLQGLLDFLTGGVADRPLMPDSPRAEPQEYVAAAIDGAIVSLGLGANEHFGRHRTATELAGLGFLRQQARGAA